MEEPLIFVNGQRHDCLPVGDRGLAYGHGLFETMKLHRGELPLWPLHRDRALEGCQRLGIPLAPDQLDHHLFSLLPALPPDGMIKLTVTAGSGGRGYRFDTGSLIPEVIVQYFPAPSRAATIHARVCHYRLPANPRLAGLKHLNRLDQVMAAAELEPGLEGVLLDNGDTVIEGLSHNLFARLDGQWHTSPLDACGVAGVMRRLVIDTLLPALGERARIEPLRIEQLSVADEVLMCNAVAGVIPVESIDGVGRWTRWPHVQALAGALEDYLS